MTPQAAYEKRYAPMTWGDAAPGVKDLWLASWTISSVIAEQAEREACAQLAECYDLGTPDGHDIAKHIRARGEKK